MAAVSPVITSASRALVRRWAKVAAAFWLVLVPHSDRTDKPVRRRTIPPNTRAIFLPILMFDSEVISFCSFLVVMFRLGRYQRSLRSLAGGLLDALCQQVLVELDLIFVHARGHPARNFLFPGER